MTQFGSTSEDERQLSEAEIFARDIRINQLNINAVLETLKFHGKCMQELANRQDTLEKHFATLKGEIHQLRATIHKALVQKYGTGSTTPEDADI